MKEGQNQHFVSKVDSAPEMESEDLRLSFQDLVSATVEPGDGALSRLWSHLSLLPREQSQEIYELLMDLELRIRRYLITEENNGKKKQQPTMYARLLVDTVNSEGEVSKSAQRALVELTSVVRAEITPILRRIHGVIAEVAPSLAKMQTIQDLTTNEGLLNTLAQGSSGREDVLSFFGALRMIGEKNENFPSINLSEVNTPQRLMIEDPLGIDTVEYFKERQDVFSSVYGRKISLPQLIASRSSSTVYELDVAAQHIAKSIKRDSAQLKDVEDDTQREKLQTEVDEKRALQRAYATLAQCVRAEAENLEGMSDTSFQSRVASLTFAWGDPDEITDILNSLEIVKHDNPELYARMLGIQTQVSFSEAQRSDLFGNVLHIAFHHSLYARTTADIQSSQFFHDRMAKLTELGATQDALVHINERQWHKLEKLLVPQASGIAQGSVTELWKAKQYAEFFQSYQLRKILEAADIERREELLQRLHEATPREFISLVKKLPHHGKNMVDDPAFVDIFRERGLIQVARSCCSDRAQETLSDETLILCTLGYITRGLRTKMPEQDRNDTPIAFGKDADVELNASLWKTTPSEKLLESGEFIRLLATTTDTVQRARSDLNALVGKPRNYLGTLQEHRDLEENIYSRMENVLSSIYSILSAHSDITKEQWLEWYQRNSPSMATGVFFGARNEMILRNKFIDTLRRLFSEFHPRHVIEHPSGFFALAETLFPSKVSLGKSPLLQHFPRIANHNSELLTIDKELRESHVKLLVHYRTTDTKTFLKDHGDEFYVVDIDAFFSLLTPKEAMDFLETLFYQERQQSLSPTELFAKHWRPHADYIRTQFPPLSEEFSEKYRTAFSSELPWLAKILNYAERFIPNAPSYSSLTDFKIYDKYLFEKYRFCKIQNQESDRQKNIWIIERRNEPLEEWYQVY